MNLEEIEEGSEQVSKEESDQESKQESEQEIDEGSEQEIQIDNDFFQNIHLRFKEYVINMIILSIFLFIILYIVLGIFHKYSTQKNIKLKIQ